MSELVCEPVWYARYLPSGENDRAVAANPHQRLRVAHDLLKDDVLSIGCPNRVVAELSGESEEGERVVLKIVHVNVDAPRFESQGQAFPVRRKARREVGLRLGDLGLRFVGTKSKNRQPGGTIPTDHRPDI